MPRRKSTGFTKRDMFPRVGKGDKTRVTNLKQYLANLAEVNLPGKVEMKRVGAKLVKTYGPVQPKPDVFMQPPIIH